METFRRKFFIKLPMVKIFSTYRYYKLMFQIALKNDAIDFDANQI